MREDQRELARLFIELERRLSDLYANCAVYYPGEFDLWKNLSLDESDHAREADTLTQAAERGQLTFVDTELRAYRLTATLQHIDEIKVAVIAGTMDGTGALKLALRVEESLDEKAVFQHFEGEDEAVQKTLAKLEEETALHAVVIRRAMNRRLLLT